MQVREGCGGHDVSYNGPRFFSFSNAGGFDWHETLQSAKDAAEMALDCERDAAGDDGWQEDDAFSICYGEGCSFCRPAARHGRGGQSGEASTV